MSRGKPHGDPSATVESGRGRIWPKDANGFVDAAFALSTHEVGYGADSVPSEATLVGALSAQLRRPRPWSATSALRRLQPSGKRKQRSYADRVANGSNRPKGGVRRQQGNAANRLRDRSPERHGRAQRLDEARRELKSDLAVNPKFTIKRFRAAAQSDNAVYLAQRERIIEGMRLAGVPEG